MDAGTLKVTITMFLVLLGLAWKAEGQPMMSEITTTEISAIAEGSTDASPTETLSVTSVVDVSDVSTSPDTPTTSPMNLSSPWRTTEISGTSDGASDASTTAETSSVTTAETPSAPTAETLSATTAKSPSATTGGTPNVTTAETLSVTSAVNESPDTPTTNPFNSSSGLPLNGSCGSSCCFNSNFTCYIDGCYCDDVCASFGDCCQDYFDVCPYPVNSSFYNPYSFLDGDIRLVGGNSPSEGRVEISYYGTWGTICDDGWDWNDANVVCKSLGFPGAIEAVLYAEFGQGTGPILFGDVGCHGNESNIFECRHAGLGIHDCGHVEDAGVRCNISSGPHLNGSCKASCCFNISSPCYADGCYCDNVCSAYGDCCSDYFDVCPNPVNSSFSTPSPVPGLLTTVFPFPGSQLNASCQFSCCVNDNSPCYADGCYCDDVCSSYGDCCLDYFDVCPNPVNSTFAPPNPVSGPEWSFSCASSCCINVDLSCYDGCFCDDVCSYYGDCCEDYFDVCPNPVYVTDIPDHITLSPIVGTMFGGTQVVISGPGLNETTEIICDFDGHNVTGKSLSVVSILCVTPAIFKMGQVPLFISVNGGETFDIQAVFTVQTPEDAPVRVHSDASNATSRVSQLNVTWDVNTLDYVDTVDVTVYGYEEVDGQIHFEPVVTLAENIEYEAGFYFSSSLPAVFLQLDVGVIGVVESHNYSQNYTPAAQWGGVHVLEWLHGHDPHQWCSDWIEEDEGEGLEFLEVTPSCPCTLSQTFLDLARFSPHPDCDIDATSPTNCLNKPGAVHCVRSNIPSVLGGAQECCYDSDGVVINIALSDGGGYSYRFHHNGVPPYGTTGKVPYMSHFLADTLPWIYCCGYTHPNAIQDSMCHIYKQLRPSQVCDNYSPPPPAIANGDPHIATLDSTMYTFNGHGEFTLLSTLDNEFVLHARTAPLTGVDATVFIAIAAKFGDSDVIHVQTNDRRVLDAYIRPADGSDFTLVDFEQAVRWTFEGVSLNGRNISSNGILVVFDGGVGLELKASEGAMSILLVAPDSFRGQTQGLMGMWNGDPSDDFLTPTGNTLPSNLSTEELHYQFGLQWEIEANESLFFYETGTNHETHTDRAYLPVFEPVINRDLNQTLVLEVCGTNDFCIFDFQTTGSESFAQTSVKTFHQYEAALASSEIVACPHLVAPVNGSVTVSRYSDGGVAMFACDDGFDISHEITLSCQPSGEWSDGDIPLCTSVTTLSPPTTPGFAALSTPAKITSGFPSWIIITCAAIAIFVLLVVVGVVALHSANKKPSKNQVSPKRVNVEEARVGIHQ